jgi:hypothetical protein
MMDQHMRNDLDNYITGHYGEDQFRQPRKKVERRKTVRAKRPVQQAKHAIRKNGLPFKNSNFAFINGDYQDTCL